MTGLQRGIRTLFPINTGISSCLSTGLKQYLGWRAQTFFFCQWASWTAPTARCVLPSETLFVWFCWGRDLCIPDWIWILSVAKDNPEFLTLLLPPPKWGFAIAYNYPITPRVRNSLKLMGDAGRDSRIRERALYVRGNRYSGHLENTHWVKGRDHTHLTVYPDNNISQSPHGHRRCVLCFGEWAMAF